MNIQMMQTTDKTMSSREIAELCNKEHRNVCRDIDILNESYVQMGLLKVEQSDYTNQQNGQSYRQYQLSKEQTIDLITGYRADIRIRINRRWAELEEQVNQSSPVVALPDFTNPVEAARAFADQYEAKQIAQEQLLLAQPKVAHYDSVVDRKGLLNATQVGQKVGMSAVKLNKILDELKVYNQAVKRSRVFNSWFIQQGLGELKQTPEGHSQALFSLRGEAWVVERLTSEGAF